MGTRITVVPNYGRDYKSKAEVKAGYDAGHDFRVQDFFSGQDGRATNKDDAAAMGLTLEIRYDRLTKMVSSTELDKMKAKV